MSEQEQLRRKRFESDYFIVVMHDGTLVVTNRRALEPAFFQQLREHLERYGVSVIEEFHDPNKEDWP